MGMFATECGSLAIPWLHLRHRGFLALAIVTTLLLGASQGGWRRVVWFFCLINVDKMPPVGGAGVRYEHCLVHPSPLAPSSLPA
jgi:hypothetical protein